jgi:hypothetical protein
MIGLSESDELTSMNPKAQLLFLSKPVAGELAAINNHKRYTSLITQLLGLSMARVIAVYKSGEDDINISKSRKAVECYYPAAEENGYTQKMLAGLPELKRMLADAQEDIMKKREKAGLIDIQTAEQVYATSLTGFGMFNCDRFSNTPQNEMAEVNIDYNGDARISFYVPSINSYIYAYRNKNGYSLKLPKGIETTLVFVSCDQLQGPILFTAKMVFTGNETIRPQPRAVTLGEMRRSLAML